MKKITLIAVLIIFSLTTNAQKKKTFELQGKAMCSSSWLFNNNISDLGPEEDYYNTFSINYGLAFNAYFGNAGIGAEILFGNIRGGYTGTYDIKDPVTFAVISKVNYNSEVNIQTLQVPLLFKLKGDKAMYLEIGPQYNSVFTANYNYDANGAKPSDTDVSKYYSTYYFSGVLGFGANIKLGESPIGILIGARFQYGFTDLKGVSGRGYDLSDKKVFPDPAITMSATAGLKLGVVYNFGEK